MHITTYNVLFFLTFSTVWNYNIYIQEPYALPPPPPSIHGTTSHHRAVSRCRHHPVENANETTQQMLPWQVNESTNNSNLKRRVRGQAQKLSSLELIACYRIIFNCLNKKSGNHGYLISLFVNSL